MPEPPLHARSLLWALLIAPAGGPPLHIAPDQHTLKPPPVMSTPPALGVRFSLRRLHVGEAFP